MRCLVVVLALAGCALPSDDLAHIRIEPRSIVLDVSPDVTPNPIELRSFAQRYDGIEYEVYGGSWSLEGKEVGEVGTNFGDDTPRFRPYNVTGGAARIRLVTADGHIAYAPVDVVVHGRSFFGGVSAFDIEALETAEIVDLDSTIHPGDGSILPSPRFPIEWTFANNAVHVVALKAPHLDLRIYDITFGNPPAEWIDPTFAAAIANTVEDGNLEIEVKSRAWNGGVDGGDPRAFRQTARVAMSDKPLEGTMFYASSDFKSSSFMLAYDFLTGGSSIFGTDFQQCFDCRMAVSNAGGRVAYTSEFGPTTLVADITDQTTVGQFFEPFHSVTFTPAGDQLLVARDSALVMYEVTGAQIAQIPVGAAATEPAISRDGKKLAWIALPERSLRVADFDLTMNRISNARTLVETDASSPDWSPDGAWIVYGHPLARKVDMIPSGGGAPIAISTDERDFEATWATGFQAVNAGGHTFELAWIAMATSRTNNGSTTGLWFVAVDPTGHVYPAIPFAGNGNFFSVPHAPVFDHRISLQPPFPD